MRLRGDDGFTLVEMLVTMLIMGVILGAVLTALEAMGHQTKIASARSDAQDGTRRAMDQITQKLRDAVSTGGAATLDRTSVNDLIFRIADDANPPVSGGANKQRLMLERYCVDGGGTLWEQVMHWTTATVTVPATTTCPGAVAVGSWENKRDVSDNVTTAGGAIFGYTPNATSPASIGIDVSVDADRSDDAKVPDPTPPTRLRNSISLRNLNSPPSVTIACTPVGSGQVICDSGGTADPDGQPLTYQWSYAPGTLNGPGTDCAGTTTAVGTGQTVLNQPGLTPNSSYCFKLVATDPTGMPGTALQVVTAH